MPYKLSLLLLSFLKSTYFFKTVLFFLSFFNKNQFLIMSLVCGGNENAKCSVQFTMVI